MTYKELAKQMAKFYKDHPGSWTQGTAARDKDGNEVGMMTAEAVQWCIVGLANKLCPATFLTRSDVYKAINPGGFCTDNWNDAPGRTEEEVILALESVS